jgi:hypothetical protein
MLLVIQAKWANDGTSVDGSYNPNPMKSEFPVEIDFEFYDSPSTTSGDHSHSAQTKKQSEKGEKKKSSGKKRQSHSGSSDSPISFDIPSIAPFC